MCGLLLALSLFGMGVPNGLSYPDMLHRQGLMYAFDGKYVQAEQCFTEALRLEPQNESLWKFRSMARGMLGNAKGAEADWVESEKWSDEHLDQAMKEAFDKKDWPTIVLKSDLFHRNNRLSPFGLYVRGTALLGLGQIYDGYHLIQKSLKRDEELMAYRGQAHYVFAILKYTIGSRTKDELQDCVQHYDLAWKYEYQTTELLIKRAAVQKELGNVDAALADLRKVILFDSNSVKYRVTLITTLTETGRWQDADEELASLKRMSLCEAEKAKYAPMIAQFEEAIAKGKPKTKGNDSSASNKWELDFGKAADERRKILSESSFPPKP